MDIVKDVESNINKAIDLMTSKNLTNIDIVIFPELFTTGYQLPIMHQISHDSNHKIFDQFKELAIIHHCHIILGSIAYKEEDQIFNTTFVINNNGEYISKYSKVHLFKLMNEHDYLSPGNELHSFELDSIMMSSIICYDLRFPEIMREIILQDMPSIIFVPMEWPAPRTELFRSLIKARAIENQCFVVSCNRIGTENGSTFEGASMVSDPYGNVVLMADDSEDIFDVLSNSFVFVIVRLIK
jgi:predicted amidohydrolase